MSPTCPTCGASLTTAPPGAPCPSCGSEPGAPNIDILLAKALNELRALPEEQVRQVLEAARVALARTPTVHALRGTIRGSAQLSLDPAVLSATGVVTTTASGEVAELPPATNILAKLLAKENRPLAIALIGLATTCAGHLREQRAPQVINNITVVAPQCPPSAPKAPEDSAPAAPRGREPLPPVKVL